MKKGKLRGKIFGIALVSVMVGAMLCGCATTDNGITNSIDVFADSSGQTEVFAGQGFDTCEIPTISQMQAWITYSPYDVVNLYIGGSCRSCSNSALTASYVSQLSQQGWKFIPTWVGPQSACWGGSCGSSISNDPATAYNQGISEANAAIDVAINLGLASVDGSGTIIYYDLEVYDTTNAACHNSAKSFISGWTAQIHARGSKAGVYGYGPAINDFASISNVPDAIWPAHWIYNSYDNGATVWNVYGLSNSLWADHQRIRQYAGGHDETWGGVTLNIDCDVIDGIVASIAPPPSLHWGKSHNVAVIDDYYGSAVGYLYPSNYPNQEFSTLSASQVSAETLANYDTVIMYMFNPSGLSTTQKAVISSWVSNGGKLIIWDSDQVPPGSPWDYSWLPYPFTTSVPGQQGAHGNGLSILEENQLSSSDLSSPYYIDTAVLNSQTDAVGDANVLTSYSSGWQIDMMATNVLGETGPAHVYAGWGSGLIIYSALDWDYAGYNYATGAGLKKMLRQELDCSYLPFAAPEVPAEYGLEVEVTSKAPEGYLVGNDIEFEVTVTNPTDKTGISVTAYNVKLTVIEPEEFEIYQPAGGINVEDIAPGESKGDTFSGKALKAGDNIEVIVNAIGWDDILKKPIGGRDSCPITIHDSEAPKPDWSYAIITDLHIGYNSQRWDSDDDGYMEMDYASSGWDDSLQRKEREGYYVTKNLENAVDKIITEKGPYNTKFVVVLGDISDTAEKSEFLKAREILNRLNDPNGDGSTDDGIPYIPLFGNHDAWPYAQDTLGADDRYRYSFIAPYATGDKLFKDIFWGESNGDNKRLIEDLFGDSWEYTYDKPVLTKARGLEILGKWVGESCGYDFPARYDGSNKYYDKNDKIPTIFECDYYLQNYGFTYDGITFVCLDLIPRLGTDLDPSDGDALPGAQRGIATDHPETVEFSKDYIQRHNPAQTKDIVLFSHYPIGPSVLNYVPWVSLLSWYDIYCFFGHVHLTGSCSVPVVPSLTSPFSYMYHGILTEDVADILPEWVHPIVADYLEKLGEIIDLGRTRETVRIVQIKNGEIDYSIALKPKNVEILWPFPDFAYPYASYPEPNKDITFTAHYTTYHGFETSFDWDFGDGSCGSGSAVMHAYSQEGDYEVTLTVTTRNLITGEETIQSITRTVCVRNKHVISSLQPDLDAASLITEEDLTQIPKNTYEPTLIAKEASEETPIAELGVHFEEANEDIDLSGMVAEVNLAEAKSVLYMPSWPEEIEQYKALYIPSTGLGTVYVCKNVTSLEEVGLENADVIINVGETKEGMTVTTTFYSGREYYLVSGVTGTGGGEVANAPPVADAGPDQVVERTSVAGAEVTLNGSASFDPDGDPLTYTWSWAGNGSASGVSPTVVMPMGTTMVTLEISDGALTDTDTVSITVQDTTPPTVTVEFPTANLAVQDGITLKASASDLSSVAAVCFYVREPDGAQSEVISPEFEDLSATLNSSTSKWEYNFDTLKLPDGNYLVLAKAVDTYDNERWSACVPFSIRNWAVITLLPSTPNSKAGRTVPVKFALTVAASVDPAQPFVWNDELTIKIFATSNPEVILQTSIFGSGSRNYRIQDNTLYITNFQTSKVPMQYTVEIWRTSKNWLVGTFTFKTVK